MLRKRHPPVTRGTNRHGTDGMARGAVGGLDVDHEKLLVLRADRDHEPPAGLELLAGGRPAAAGPRRRRRCRETAPAAGRPSVPSRVMDVNAIGVAGRGERSSRAVRERRNPFERVHFARQLGEHCRLIAGAGSDVEHASRRPAAAAPRRCARPCTAARSSAPRRSAAPHRRTHARAARPARRALAERVPSPRARVRHRCRARAAGARPSLDGQPTRAWAKCASTAGVTSVMRSIAASTPTVSIGTIESPATSEPWLPPPA